MRIHQVSMFDVNNVGFSLWHEIDEIITAMNTVLLLSNAKIIYLCDIRITNFVY